MARPRIPIDKEQFEKLCALQCTKDEIAGFFDCSEDTVERFCHRTYKESFAVVFGQKRTTGKISLRRTQWKMSETNVAMAIWLGKQYLGQKETQDIKVTASDDDTIKAMEEFFKEKKDEYNA